MKLYHHPKTRSIRPFVLLEELGVDYEVIPIDFEKKEHKTEEFLEINPLGELPVFTDGDVQIGESVAICLYLADKFADRGLAPPLDSPERAQYLFWSVFTVGTLEPALMAVYRAKEQEPADATAAADGLKKSLGLIEEALGDRDTLLPSGFSAADVLIGSTVAWVSMTGADVGERLGQYVASLMARPAFQKALAG